MWLQKQYQQACVKLIMLILNSTDISILGLFLIDRWELKQFKMHTSMWKFTFLNKSDVKTEKKDGIETAFLFTYC